MNYLLITVAQIIILTNLCEPASASRENAPAIDVKVMVLNYDPKIHSHNDKPLHEVHEYNNPRELADGYIRDIAEASDNLVRCRVVSWKDIDQFPAKKDGFIYNSDSWMRCWNAKSGWHQPNRVDYERILRDEHVTEYISNGQIDEVWLFGAHEFGYCESAMAGPGSFFINGDTFANVPSKRPFAIMGFNYERGVAEMIHDLCHRAESTMSHFYEGWNQSQPSTNWDKFSAVAVKCNGVSGVGNCHFPPNGKKDYDYENHQSVASCAEGFLNYPFISNKTSSVNCETWGGPDYPRNYLKWWFKHFPRAAGVNEDGKLNNWWRYLFEFPKYMR